MKRKFDLAKISSTYCEEYKNCKACWEKYNEEELMSYIYTGVKNGKSDLIDYQMINTN